MHHHRNGSCGCVTRPTSDGVALWALVEFKRNLAYEQPGISANLRDRLLDGADLDAQVARTYVVCKCTCHCCCGCDCRGQCVSVEERKRGKKRHGRARV